MSLLNCERHGHSHYAVACPKCVREMSASEMERLRATLLEAQEWIEEHPPDCQCESGEVESATCPHYSYGDLRVRIDAALSGGSAPQAPDSEELLKALRAAYRVLNRVIGLYAPDMTATPQGHSCMREICEAQVLLDAALSMKSEGSDPDSSQKGSGR